MQKLLLSIGIPTYNGSKHIKEALDSIVAQIKGIEQEIEIVISDNASTDETPQIIKEYQSQYPIIRYFRNEENLGFDKNVDLLFKRAQGKYVWLLSDDDTLEKNSISVLLNKLTEYKNTSVVFLNYAECDINMKEYPHRQRADIYQDIYCENGDIFFQRSKFLFGLISSLVIETEAWNQSDVAKYIGGGFVHVGVLVEILQNHSALIISDKLVNLRTPETGNERWRPHGYSATLQPGFELVKIFKGMKDLGYEKKTYTYLIDNMYRANLKTILCVNLYGVNNKKEIAVNMIKSYGRYPTFWLIHLPFLLTPHIVFKMLRRIKHFLNNSISKK